MRVQILSQSMTNVKHNSSYFDCYADFKTQTSHANQVRNEARASANARVRCRLYILHNIIKDPRWGPEGDTPFLHWRLTPLGLLPKTMGPFGRLWGVIWETLGWLRAGHVGFYLKCWIRFETVVDINRFYSERLYLQLKAQNYTKLSNHAQSYRMRTIGQKSMIWVSDESETWGYNPHPTNWVLNPSQGN